MDMAAIPAFAQEKDAVVKEVQVGKPLSTAHAAANFELDERGRQKNSTAGKRYKWASPAQENISHLHTWPGWEVDRLAL